MFLIRGDDEDGSDHQVWRGAHDVQEPAHRDLDETGRHVARGQQAQRYGRQDGQTRTPERDLDRQPHLADVELPVGEIGPQEL